jgi:hypothetical protein
MSDERVQDDAPKPETTPRGRRLFRAGLIVVTIVVLVDASSGKRHGGADARTTSRQPRGSTSRRCGSTTSGAIERARRYREDPATLEELARRDLGFIKPGEKLFIIRDLPPAQPR